jgi:hypothetical protein
MLPISICSSQFFFENSIFMENKLDYTVYISTPKFQNSVHLVLAKLLAE